MSNIDILAAGRRVAVEHRIELERLLVDLELPAPLAASVDLHWDGAAFQVRSSRMSEINALEFGNGTQPPLAAIHKAMNRLRPVLQAAVQEILREQIVEMEQGVLF